MPAPIPPVETPVSFSFNNGEGSVIDLDTKQPLVTCFITEEKALGISEHNTIDWRRQNNIPDSDGIEFVQTRNLTQFQQLI